MILLLEAFNSKPDQLYNMALLGTLVLTLAWEAMAPRRKTRGLLRRRWPANWALLFINMSAVYAVYPVTTLAVAVVAEQNAWGVFSQLSLPFAVMLVISLLLIDLANYVRHYLMHRVPILWRIHRAHHSDPEMDVSTSLRFHPLEPLLAVAVDMMVIVALGTAPVVVVAYRVLRVTLSTLVHGNIRMPTQTDALLRYFIVTPDLHRVHHSTQEAEHNRNFSGGLIWWDRLFGTYLAAPDVGYRQMRIGLPGYDLRQSTSLLAVLIDPLTGPRSPAGPVSGPAE